MRHFEGHKTRTLVTATLAVVLSCVMALASCGSGNREKGKVIMSATCYPYAVLHNGKYYFLRQQPTCDRIVILCSSSLDNITEGDMKTVWMATDSTANRDIWVPELHRIGGKWYIYFEADDGNTDNHQIYVIENPSDDPMKGEFRMKGVLKTNDEWNFGIHPSTFVVGNRQYLVWSGWPKRRSETETQCIYIAGMSNPWTVSTRRVMISKPTHEWERQWINPDGTRSAYPIYVNENPQPVVSRDGKKVAIYFAASACWTPYACLGVMYADTKANLLDSRSWHKSGNPVTIGNGLDSIRGASNICVVDNNKGNDPYMLYETKFYDKTAHNYVKQIRLRTIEWGQDGLPVINSK